MYPKSYSIYLRGALLPWEEVDALAEHFTEHGAHVAPPAIVNYIKPLGPNPKP